MNPTVYWLLAVVTGALALTRATRLVVDDSYPPAEAFRRWWMRHTSEDWNPLVECPWCAAPSLALPAVAYAAVFVANQDVDWIVWSWWLLNGWAAASWIAAFLTLRDVPPDSR